MTTTRTRPPVLKRGTRTQVNARRHTREAWRVGVETVVLSGALCALGVWLSRQGGSPWVTGLAVGLAVMQGLMLQRMYIVGHEVAHRKLIPGHLGWNDAVGQGLTLPTLIPVAVYRCVHDFHHGFNRKDEHTSALDVFVTRGEITPLKRAYFHTLWLLGVFAGGFYLHSVASVVVFLCLPTRLALRLSPAFRKWGARERRRAWGQFLACVAFHVGFAAVFGTWAWVLALGFPMLVFAWVWSLLMYMFHFHTSIGPQARFNTRSVRRDPFWSWLLLDFHEHATHHMYPNIPWYALQERRAELPPAYQAVNERLPFWRAVWQQWRGPTILRRDGPNPVPHLFVRWED
ncbi:hypothetical protein DEIPH_ctg033orf0101 [Deinococcus phoenicis]|uniref:Fatty acid desaturase domain-containing protein n=1 Tax=Deinococcus phoenicis TaxID=1476583 RepID=A0A016QNW4_9DEIO|nr:fatty acid desaturase [Deinococcus phoenicis]EYB67681.1 hypothetical protein DEIPH_ctg033orf0101 [Deinococcus phoenicis]